MNFEEMMRKFGLIHQKEEPHELIKQPAQQFVMPSTPRERLEALVTKWRDLCEGFYMVRSVVEDRSAPVETWYGQMPPRGIVRGLLTDTLVTHFLSTNVNARYSGGPRSSYDQTKKLVTVVHTGDLLPILGYALLDTMPLPKNPERLKDCKDFSLRDSYASLVGAYSDRYLTQQPEPVHEHIDRRNTVDEHFGRNLDRLLRIRTLHVLPDQVTSLDDMLDLYLAYGIIDNKFEKTYRRCTSRIGGRRGLKEVPVDDMPFTYSRPVTTDELLVIATLDTRLHDR